MFGDDRNAESDPIPVGYGKRVADPICILGTDLGL